MKKNSPSYYNKQERRVLVGMVAIMCISVALVYFLGSNTNSTETVAETDTAYVYVKDTVLYYKGTKKYSKKEENFKKRNYVPREGNDYKSYYRGKELDTIIRNGKIRLGEHVTLNVADTTQLKKVPGIGSYYSKQIVRYGERLGGYVNTDQIDEINVPDEVKVYLDVDTSDIRKLNVNTLTLEQLRRHPYINFYVARSIVDYRKRYGRINDIDDLRLDPNLPDDLRNRLRPYLEY